MATEQNKIVVEFESKGQGNLQKAASDTAESFAKLKKAALNGDGAAAKRVAELKDKIDDLKDSTKTLMGSGVERASNSFSLLGEGLRNFDFDKVKTGFSGIGAAMKAIPIFLIAEGVSYLIENWEELSEGNGILAKTLQAVGEIFDWIGDKINEFTDLIGATNTALEEQGEAIKTNADKAKEALAAQTAEYDRQIKVAKANGKDTIEIEKAKQEAIIQTNVVAARQIEAYVRAGGEFTDELRKQLTGHLEAIKSAKVDEFVIEKEHTKKLNDEYKKRNDDKKKAEEDLFNAALAEQQRLEDLRTKEIEKEREEERKLNERRAKDLEDLKNLQLKADQEEVANKIAMWEQEAKAKEDLEKKKAQLEQQAYTSSVQTSQNLLAVTQSVSDIIYTSKLAKTKKGTVEEEKLMRKQFEVNKKLQIAQVTISSAAAAVEAYKSLAGIPFVGPVLGGIAAAAAVLQGVSTINKIRSTQFESGGSLSADTTAPNLSANSAPSLNTQAPSTQVQPFTKLDEEGNVTGRSGPVKAYVVETEMSDSQKRVGRLTGQASFP